MRNSLILIGYMGSGKTSVGHRLARRLKLPFWDTDQLIEEKEGLSIGEIFSTQGEEAFRQMETCCLRRLMEDGSAGVISVGGGTPLREENRRLLKEMGRVYYLKAEPATIFERVKSDDTRPLLQTENPRERIEEMLKQREPAYISGADRVIRVENKSVEEIAEEIVKHENTGH